MSYLEPWEQTVEAYFKTLPRLRISRLKETEHNATYYKSSWPLAIMS